ncbi:hypothetical protein [Bacillus sp. S3]|uniref:hypothetical protein n=1 Tax=Bacillus sp. S3 TaxID=486398 RepID=UPI0016805172|nr:hypothetical protein [Bacillus sp. S3]
MAKYSEQFSHLYPSASVRKNDPSHQETKCCYFSTTELAPPFFFKPSHFTALNFS